MHCHNVNTGSVHSARGVDDGGGVSNRLRCSTESTQWSMREPGGVRGASVRNNRLQRSTPLLQESKEETVVAAAGIELTQESIDEQAHTGSGELNAEYKTITHFSLL